VTAGLKCAMEYFPNYEYSIAVIFGVEILATVFLMGGILLVVSSKKIHLGIIVALLDGAFYWLSANCFIFQEKIPKNQKLLIFAV
jgi:hypothetical protein